MENPANAQLREPPLEGDHMKACPGHVITASDAGIGGRRRRAEAFLDQACDALHLLLLVRFFPGHVVAVMDPDAVKGRSRRVARARTR